MNDHTQAPLPSAPRHRIGQVVRMLSATVFLVSFAATCYLSLLAPVFGPRAIPDTWALAVVVVALLTAPLGDRRGGNAAGAVHAAGGSADPAGAPAGLGRRLAVAADERALITWGSLRPPCPT